MSTPPANPPSSAPSRVPGGSADRAARFAGVALVLIPALARAMAPAPSLPHWDFDPLLYPVGPVGLGPALSMLLDAAALAGAGLCLWSSRTCGRAIVIGLSLLAFGALAVLHHGWLAEFATVQHQRIGLSWLSALAGGIALAAALRDRVTRAVVAATLMSFLVVLAARGIEQVVIEHPQTVADFRAGRERIFAAQGWTADSPMARSYERRLLQNDASGWFGLSNVYASFAAAGCAGFLAWLLTSERASRWPAAVGLAASGIALALAESKGATVSLGFGLVFIAGVVVAHRRGATTSAGAGTGVSRMIAWLPPLLTAAALLAIVARGAVALRLGELSLLFRWFYIEAATRIALGLGEFARPWQGLLGVGPDGFKDAYTLAKNPLSPEEVTSPHSILFDWWACLGIPGVAWVLLLVLVLVRIGSGHRAPGDTQPSAHTAPLRPALRLAAGIAVASVLAAIGLNHGAISPSNAMVFVGGLLAWCVLSVWLARGLIKAPDRGLWAGSAAAAVVLAVHAQVEVTASLPSSVGLWAAVLGVAASPALASVARSAPTDRSRAAAIAAGVCVLAAAWVVWAGVVPAWRWESGLRESAGTLSPVATARRMLDEAPRASTRDRAEMLAIAADGLGTALGRRVEPMPAEIARAAAEAERLAIPRAADILDRLDPRMDWRVRRERARLRLTAFLLDPGAAAPTPIDGPRPWLIALPPREAALMWTGSPRPPQPPWRALALSWNATALQAVGERTADPNLSRAALDALDEAQEFDPLNMMLAARRMETAHRLGDASRAAQAAREALRLEELSRLDPTRRLTDAQRTLAERLAGPGAMIRPGGP